MNSPATELARPEMVTGLRITADGSVQKVEIPKMRSSMACTSRSAALPSTWSG